MAPPSQELEPPINPGRFNVRLRKIQRTAMALLKTARRLERLTIWNPGDDAFHSKVLSLDQSMKLYFNLSGEPPQIDIELAGVMSACSTGLLQVAPLASKRGAKGDLNH